MKRQEGEYTLKESIDLIRAFSLFPAITVMVFIRRKLGFRMMKSTWLITLAGTMSVVPVAFKAAARPFGSAMVIYALAMLGLGLWQRRQRWLGLCRGERWHSYSGGISYLEYLPLPSFFKSHARVRRFLDPVVIALLSLPVGFFCSHILGVWLIFSAFFLHVHEQRAHDVQLIDAITTLDNILAAELQAENAKFFEAGAQEQQQTLEESVGIQAGLDSDIARQIAIRKANLK